MRVTQSVASIARERTSPRTASKTAGPVAPQALLSGSSTAREWVHTKICALGANGDGLIAVQSLPNVSNAPVAWPSPPTSFAHPIVASSPTNGSLGPSARSAASSAIAGRVFIVRERSTSWRTWVRDHDDESGRAWSISALHGQKMRGLSRSIVRSRRLRARPNAPTARCETTFAGA